MSEGVMNALTGSLMALGDFGLFVGRTLAWLKQKPFRWRLLVDELESIGHQSLFITALTGFFTGAVLSYQSWLAFKIVGTTSLVSATVCLSLVRELGPVMTAIVLSGRAGAGMAAKIGIMRVTEQIDALEVMGVSPKQYLVLPRLIAAAIALPILASVFSLVGNVGGYIVGVLVCLIDQGIYIQQMKFYLVPWDYLHGVFKSVFFGFIMAAICCYQGYYAKNGAEGVGTATNRSVVISIVTILVTDYFLSTIIPTGVRGQ
ncbi:MAG TPA: ABC transporter permease [Bdellovibrionota bacterium]|jgi:phospholipid/cholesterol/gamma-HCH transport system permease protein|nr:ABC transporter permease [Bdellovibrionota bacterium]